MLALHYRCYGSGTPLVILHGLFGSSDNWHSLARRWSRKFRIYTLDLRNHGASPHDSLMSYAAMAQDLGCFLDEQHLQSAFLLGHSMGGKVAMLFAAEHADRVKGLVVLDIGVARTEGRHTQIIQALEHIHPGDFQQRGELENVLKEYVQRPAISQFLLKNVLRRVDGSLGWKFNQEALLANYETLTADLELDEPYLGPTLFLRGEHSDYLETDLYPELLRSFPMAQLKTITDAGHWLHAEQPDQVYERVEEFLSSLSGKGA